MSRFQTFIIAVILIVGIFVNDVPAPVAEDACRYSYIIQPELHMVFSDWYFSRHFTFVGMRDGCEVYEFHE